MKSAGKSARRSVVLLGKGSLAKKVGGWFLASEVYDLCCVVPSIPEPTWTDSLLTWARTKGVSVVESGDYRDVPDAGKIDLAMSVFYSKIIGRPFIDRCGRILNLHNGPLPRYRGVSPINWALKNGEIEHGVTIHEITAGIDEGPIVAQVKFPIYPAFDEVRDVYERSLNFGWLLFETTLPLLGTIEPRPQDESQALTYTRRDDGQLGERRDFTRRDSLSRAGAPV